MNFSIFIYILKKTSIWNKDFIKNLMNKIINNMQYKGELFSYSFIFGPMKGKILLKKIRQFSKNIEITFLLLS